MRRFSQRSALVTLSEINITPLLDLAFVLLIIFVITTPLLEQTITMKLPVGGAPTQVVPKTDIRTIEISPQGVFTFERHRMTADQIEAELKRDFQLNPNLVVRIRVDQIGLNKDTVAILDRCRKNGITHVDLQTEPPPRRP